jgi:4-amino-4-deoxy-L-arabinose transferase-like glycosyltransferase
LGTAEAISGDATRLQDEPRATGVIPDRVTYWVYGASLAVAISIWFIAIRSPLWLDETGSYWVIKDGFGPIWSRHALEFPAYYYVLGLLTKILGTSEIALRVPSVLAMMGAVYLLYRAARELFNREIAIVAVLIFCLNPIVIFTSIDARPYAFAVLATNAGILIALRMRSNNSNWIAALWGLTSACIVYFHYLFAAILPALVICFFAAKKSNRKIAWRQFGVAAAVFVLASLPMIPGLRSLFHTRASHVVGMPPKLHDLVLTLAPGWLPFAFIAIGLVSLILAALRTAPDESGNAGKSLASMDRRRVLQCLSLALIPVLLLYGISKGTSMQLFIMRYRLVAVPGIALCWAFLVSLFPSRTARLAMCLGLVAGTSFTYLHTPFLREHDPTWKYALTIAEKNASADGASVLMYSPFVEGNWLAEPIQNPKESRFFAPLFYYKVSVPVVAMPYSLNAESVRLGSQFLREATQKRERFLTIGDPPSYKAMDWLAQRASGNYAVRKLGVFDDTEVLEFDPRVDRR